MTIELYNAGFEHNGDVLFKDVSFTASSGEIVIVSSANSIASKHVLQSFLGLQPLTSGYASVDGEPVNIDTGAFYRHQMSYLPADFEPSAESVEGLARMMFRMSVNKDFIYSKDAIVGEFQMLALDAVHFERRFSELTPAEVQRVMLAFAGMFGRPVLLLDNPTSMQDEEGRVAVMSYLCSKKFIDTAIVIASNDLSVRTICTKSICID